jgi:ferredoxin
MLQRHIKRRPIPCKVSRTQPLISMMSTPTRPPVVRVEPLGQSFEAPDSLTILEAAAFANLRLPRSCRNGTCRTCLCRMRSGRVRYLIEWPGVSREEKAQGYILPCVAIAETDLVIEVPEAVVLAGR